MTSVTISIVIPVYARQQVGERAVRSALAQEGVPFEIIVVDDGSPEPFVLAEDLRGHPDIRVIRLERNSGASAARNRGVREARGSWIAFLDSDDLWLGGKLVRQLSAAQAAGDAGLDVYVTGFRQIGPGPERDEQRIPRPSSEAADFAAGCWFAPGTTSLVPRRAFDIVGPLDESLPRLEDLDWYLRLGLSGGSVTVIPEILAIVEVGGKPSSARLEAGIRGLEQKWLAHSAASRLSEPARGHMQAYLDVERASVFHAERRWWRMGLALLRSFVRRPRLRLHIKDWW